VLPPVAFAEDEEGASCVEPMHRIGNVNPRLRLVAKDASHVAVAGVAEEHVVAILQAVQLLN
jgi:hypothetical protein